MELKYITHHLYNSNHCEKQKSSLIYRIGEQGSHNGKHRHRIFGGFFSGDATSGTWIVVFKGSLYFFSYSRVKKKPYLIQMSSAFNFCQMFSYFFLEIDLNVH